MLTDWLETLLGGSHEIILPALSFVRGTSTDFQGSGYIRWAADSGIRIVAYTDGADVLHREFGRVEAAPGHLIPHDRYISVQGRTEDDWDVSTIPVWTEGYTLRDSPRVFWDFGTNGLSLTRETGRREHPRLIRALMGPPPASWPRATHSEMRNDGEKSSASRSDCLLADFGCGHLYTHLRADGWFEARITIKETSPPIEPLEITGAVGQAFGFVLGRRQFLLGFEDLVPGRETRRLFVPDPEPTKNSILAPLGKGSAYLHHVEGLLGQAIDFFLTKEGRRVADHLFLCWDAADNAFSTQLAVASISLEGLISLIPHQPGTDKGAEAESEGGGSTGADVEALEKWLGQKEVSEAFANRLRGTVAAFKHRRPADVIWDWQRKGLLGVTQEDIDAWKKARNRAAHGAAVTLPEDKRKLQEAYLQFVREINLINRVVLQMMGYRGLYVDYGSAWWPEVEFPATAPESL